MTNYIALAIPFFFVCIGAELLVARRLGRTVYRFPDAVTDLGCGIASQLSMVFLHVVLLSVYVTVYQRFRLTDAKVSSPIPWLVTFVVVDFIYYWWHRLSHEVNFLWAAHVVHHSSEDYNLAVALRQAVATNLTVVPFYLPLALAGIPPVIYVTILSFNTLYQFWIHTELIGKLGSVELWLNTPSAHRVHHAINTQYLDKNYGGTTLVWDRLFGTYEEEREACVYGIVKPLQSYNPFVAQFHHWAQMAASASKTPRFADKVRVWLRSPAWTAPGIEPYPLLDGVTPETFHKYDPKISRPLTVYVLLQFSLGLVAAVLLLFFQDQVAGWKLWLPAAFVVLTLLSAGAFFEGKSWARPLEGVRYAVLAASAVAVLAL